MAKANVTLPNGTTVEIEGTTDEIQKLLEFYSGVTSPVASPKTSPSTKKKNKHRAAKKAGSKKSTGQVDLAEIVNQIKSCNEAEAIETQILDRTSQVNRTMLPMFIIHEYFDNDHTLTSGEISKVLTDLGIPLSQANVSRTLGNTASKYVMGDKVRKRGQAVRYKLSRRGLQYIKKVLDGS